MKHDILNFKEKVNRKNFDYFFIYLLCISKFFQILCKSLYRIVELVEKRLLKS